MTENPHNDQIIPVNKPLRWTSFDVVKKLKYGLKVKKIGHAGTLDPLATGLLICCTGKMTKQINTIQSQEKEYEGTIVLGETTPSYDLETTPENKKETKHLTTEDIIGTTQYFKGEIQQIPPAHSAVKVDGQRAYKLARKGVKVEIKPRTVTISSFEILEISESRVDFRVVCSKGTYIRTLAHDFGQKLGVGGYLARLVRTRIGDYKLENAATIEELLQQ